MEYQDWCFCFKNKGERVAHKVKSPLNTNLTEHTSRGSCCPIYRPTRPTHPEAWLYRLGISRCTLLYGTLVV